MSTAAVATFRVLVADAISEAGVALLRATDGFDVAVETKLPPDALRSRLRDADALIVRSATRVTEDALADAKRLRVIGRAGTGVDNIDLEAATRAGIVVLNAPGANAVAAAEHTICLLLALARHVSPAHAALREGRWERSRYTGVELAGKTLGVVGLGRIGREVARRAIGLRMSVLGYDPYVSESAVADLGVACAPLPRVLGEADVVTLHVPLARETGHLVDRAAIAGMKRGARLINCARGGLVDEAALLEALESGHLAGAALDVFETEPPEDLRLVRHPAVVATPHLGASTVEAQERVGTEIAEKVRDFLLRGTVLDAVNFPSLGRDEHEAARPVMELAERLGRFVAQIVEGGVRRLEVRALGAFAQLPLKPIVMAATRGLLSPVLVGGATLVNALALARDRGITVEEARSTEATPFAGLLRLTVTTDRATTAIAGTLLSDGRPRVVELDGLPIESTPDGHLVLLRNQDVPGVVGRVGTVLGQAGVNIAGLQLGRERRGGAAVSVIDVDGPVPADALAALRELPGVLSVVALVV